MNIRIKKSIPFGLVVFISVLPVMLMDGVSAAETRFVSIGTGGTGGVYYLYGGGVAELWSNRAADLDLHLVDTATGDDQLIFTAKRCPTNPDGGRNAAHGHPAWSWASDAVVFNAQPCRNSRVYLMLIGRP